MGFDRAIIVPYDYVKKYTDDFSQENLIGNFQFGKVYRGKMEPLTGTIHITVKIWEDPLSNNVVSGANESRLMDELCLLQHKEFNFHPTLVKVNRYCCEGEKIGIVYDLDSLDTVYNLVDKDNFTWLHRIKVAFGIACLLRYLHTEVPLHSPILMRNIDPAHIMLDKDYKPKLFDFGMITGGIFPDRTKLQIQYGRDGYGYGDPFYGSLGGWSDKTDVFAFGVLLLMLIAKRADAKEDGTSNDASSVYNWARNQYKTKNPKISIMGFGQQGCSLVHKSLEEEQLFCSSDGHKVTKLAMQCVEYDPEKRPTMLKVVKYLRGLHVVRRHARTLGLDKMIRDYNKYF